MSLLLPSFPKPGEYKRYWDDTAKRFKYLQLVDAMGPLTYPWRLGSAAPTGKTSLTTLRDLNPSSSRRHRYLAYMGVRPGAFYYISLRYDQEQLNWDETVQFVDRDQTHRLTWDITPYEAPQFKFWIGPGGYPGLQAINITENTLTPEVLFIATDYKVLEEADLAAPTLVALKRGEIYAEPISFGGPFS